jgi:hypothetical protein
MNARAALFATIVGRAAVSAFALFALMQLVPYGRDHAPPPTIEEPQWVSAESRLLAKRACFDCHSNETRWPWYSNIAPVSWLVQGDVEEGRRHFNLSEWNRPQKDDREAIGKLREGEMPPSSYLPLHPEARLSTIEREHLIDAIDGNHWAVYRTRVAKMKSGESCDRAQEMFAKEAPSYIAAMWNHAPIMRRREARPPN